MLNYNMDEEESYKKETVCENCKRLASCEEIPIMGYTLWFCEGCYNAKIASGELGT